MRKIGRGCGLALIGFAVASLLIVLPLAARADNTIGQTTDGTSTDQNGPGIIAAIGPFTVSGLGASGATLGQVHINATADGSNVYVGLYDGNSSGIPAGQSKLSVAGPITLVSNGTATASMSAYTIHNGTFWVVVESNTSSTWHFKYTSHTLGIRGYVSSPAGLPAVYPTGGTTYNEWPAVWIDYSPIVTGNVYPGTITLARHSATSLLLTATAASGGFTPLPDWYIDTADTGDGNLVLLATGLTNGVSHNIRCRYTDSNGTFAEANVIATASPATYYYSQNGAGTHAADTYANRGAYTDLNARFAAGATAPKDTVYFCGPFISTDTTDDTLTFHNSGNSGPGDGNIYLRFDYPGDPGSFYYFGLVSGGTLHSVDPNNGYYRYDRADYDLYLANAGTVSEEWLPTRLALNINDPNGTWTDPAHSGTYLKLSGGAVPSISRLYRTGIGEGIGIAGGSCLTYIGGTFYGMPYTTSTGATHITFEGVTSKFGEWDVNNGNDYWTWHNCEISNAANGIYAKQGTYGQGYASANYGTVSYCKIHDMGWMANPIPDANVPGLWVGVGDNHAIGLQYVSNWVIDHNECYHTSDAIEDYTTAWGGPLYNANDFFTNNAIHDTFSNYVGTNSGGITVYDGYAVIRGNVLWNIGGTAISCATADGNTVVENNSIFNYGIDHLYWVYPAAISFRNGTCRNNIAMDGNAFILLYTPDPNFGSVNIDYNLFAAHGDGGSSHDFATTVLTNGISGATTYRTLATWRGYGYDTHSQTGSIVPGWLVASPAAWADFRLRPDSPALGGGVLTTYLDAYGNPFLGTKDQGAYMFLRKGIKK